MSTEITKEEFEKFLYLSLKNKDVIDFLTLNTMFFNTFGKFFSNLSDNEAKIFQELFNKLEEQKIIRLEEFKIPNRSRVFKGLNFDELEKKYEFRLNEILQALEKLCEKEDKGFIKTTLKKFQEISIEKGINVAIKFLENTINNLS